jgi:HSP20 family protein
MKILPWRKRDDLANFRNAFDDLFGRILDNDYDGNLPAAFREIASPPVDVAETEKSWTYSFELPGMREKDIQVQLMGQQLVVSAERNWEEEKKGKEFHRVESRYGAFQRSVALPENARLDPDALTATYKKGILEISIPKVEPTPAAKIPVKAG